MHSAHGAPGKYQLKLFCSYCNRRSLYLRLYGFPITDTVCLSLRPSPPRTDLRTMPQVLLSEEAKAFRRIPLEGKS